MYFPPSSVCCLNACYTFWGFGVYAQKGPLKFGFCFDNQCVGTIQSTIFIHCCHMVIIPTDLYIFEGLFIS